MSSRDDLSGGRDRESDLGRGMQENVKKEVKEFFRKGYSGKLPYEELQLLRMKYKNEDILDKIQEEIYKAEKHVDKKIKKFTKYMIEHTDGKIPMHELIKKAMKYKHKMTDYEFNEFYKLVQKKLASGEFGTDTERAEYIPRTRINKVLGQQEESYTSTSKLNVEIKDMPVLQEIMNDYVKYRSLHSDVSLQSLSYEDIDLETLSGSFDRKQDHPAIHIHPVIMAMFAPKIDFFERLMIYGNIASIIKAKKDGKPFKTSSDSLLHYCLINSQNDVVCDPHNPLVDLKNRYKIQIILQENIIKLRLGLYYCKESTSLLTALESCSNIPNQDPDMFFNQGPDMIYRKLSSVFGARPMVVKTEPYMAQSMSTPVYNPYGESVLATRVTTLPLITYRLLKEKSGMYDLNDALYQPQWYLENKNLVIKSQELTYSNGVIVIHVSRKIVKPQIPQYTSQLQFKELPLTIMSDATINPVEISYPDMITLDGYGQGQSFYLKSVVCVRHMIVKNKDKQEMKENGAITLLKDKDGKCYEYDPLSAYKIIKVGDKSSSIKPIAEIPEDNPFSDMGTEETFTDLGFKQKASMFGTLFFYVNNQSKV